MSRPLFAMVFIASVSSPVLADDAADRSAREVSERFMKATQAENVDDILSIVDVPWFHQGERVIRDREELGQEFDRLFKKRDLGKLEFEIKRIVPYHVVREKSLPDERKLLDEVLTKDDRIVLLQVGPAEKKESVVLLVRLRDNQAKVVGIKD